MLSLTNRIIVITGANKGIGYSIAKLLFTGKTPYNVILTARNPVLGQKALKEITDKHSHSSSQLDFHQLDVDDNKSIKEFVNWIVSKYGKVDALVNNAGIGYDSATVEERLATIQTNFFGAVNLTEQLLPHLTEDGKVIMISSGSGALNEQGKQIIKILDDEKLTEGQLIELANQLVEKTKTLKHKDLGFSEHTYHNTKALLNAYTRWILPKKLRGEQQCFTVCPGWCRTDMGGSAAPNSSEDGADTPVYLINLPWKRNDELNGKFLRKRRVIKF